MVSSFIRLALAVNFALAVSGLVIPRIAPGTQFITGPCTSDADCASTCCGVKTNTCNARAVAEGPTGGGCLGDALAASVPAAAAASTAAAPAGTQFITGKCSVDGDCASGCCGAKTGVCNARAVAEGPGGGGCGGSAAAAAPPAAAPPAAAPPAAAPPATPAAAAPASTGTQFITGKCSADSDCASGCCGAKTGVCNARAVAEGPGGGGCGGSSAAAAPPAAAPPAAAPPAAAPPATPAAAAPASTGTQFITGKCSADSDCASGCCGAKTGVCNARAVAEGPGGGGCGGSSAAAAPPAAAPPAASPPATPAAAAPASTGTQFITGVCSADSDCASGCCGAKTGVCNARAVAEGPGGGGCGGKSA